MKKLSFALLTLLLLLAVVYLAGSWYFSGLIVKFTPHTLAEQRAEHGDPAAYNLPAPEEISFAGDGVRLSGWYFDNPTAGGCAALILHGHTTSRYAMLKYAPLFWERGCDLMFYDHRHHGGSAGDYGTYGYYEKQDALAALTWLQQRSGLAADKIAVMGESYGAATALQLVSIAPDLALVAADSPYEDLQTIIGEQAEQRFGGWTRLFVPGALALSGLRADFAPSQVSPVRAVTELSEPLFLSHSASDAYTDPHHSVDIEAAVPATVCQRFHLTDWGAEHGQSIDDDYAAYAAQFDEFLAACAPDFGVKP
ncbi:MAG: alpha/beta fold hydrolase [Caldilineales bacterium]